MLPYSRFAVLPILLFCSGTATAAPAADCGTVSTFAFPPETRYFYPAEISRIDEKNVFESKQEHRLPPGEYTLKVYEKIDAPELRVNGRNRGYAKLLKLRVEAGHVYRIAAKFDHLRPFDRNRYWEPVVWKDEARPCSL